MKTTNSNCKLTYAQMKRMADNAHWAENMYIDLGITNQAIRYNNIRRRIMKGLKISHTVIPEGWMPKPNNDSYNFMDWSAKLYYWMLWIKNYG